jgi:thioredoxin 1
MNNKILIFVVIILLSTAGFWYFKANKNISAPTPLATQDPEDKGPREIKGGGSYSPYSSGVLEENKDKRRILFFYANWCPTCKPADKSFTENISNIPEGIVVIRVNYNDPDTDSEEEELAKKYEVTYQHTFVEIDGEGKAVQRWNGGNFEDFLSNL